MMAPTTTIAPTRLPATQPAKVPAAQPAKIPAPQVYIDIEQSRALDWAALTAWRDLYMQGLRLTYNGERFQLYQCNWTPGRRVEESGAYNIFDLTKIDPSPEVYQIVRAHAVHMVKVFPKGVPAPLEDRFFQLLSQPELYSLQVDCEKMGVICTGLPMAGGQFPTIIDHIADTKISAKEVKRNFDPGKVRNYSQPPLLTEYLDGFGELGQRYWDKPTYSQDHGTAAARDRRAAESRDAVEASEVKSLGAKANAKS